MMTNLSPGLELVSKCYLPKPSYGYTNPANQVNDIHDASEALHLRSGRIVRVGPVILPPYDHGINRELDAETTIK
jgi:hypothetical protein